MILSLCREHLIFKKIKKKDNRGVATVLNLWILLHGLVWEHSCSGSAGTPKRREEIVYLLQPCMSLENTLGQFYSSGMEICVVITSEILFPGANLGIHLADLHNNKRQSRIRRLSRGHFLTEKEWARILILLKYCTGPSLHASLQVTLK